MTQFLIEHFVKDYEDVEKISVRTAYGVLASIVGIFCNVFLFAVKFTIGVIAHSVSVMADAFNNLSDAGSSIISFIGVKLWLGLFNKRLGEKINSKVMMAVFADSMGDVITTGATILSLIVFRITGWNIDGVVGIGVALVVMWAGVGIAKDTLEPLIGEAIDPQVYDQIKAFVEKYDGIVGTHDLIVHNYGPGRSMASIHAEVPNDVDIEKSHEIIDRIERDAKQTLGLFLVIHMDPVEMKDENVLKIRKVAEKILRELDPSCSLHDFRIVHGTRQINLVFDMVIPINYDEERRNELPLLMMERLKQIDNRYECVITVDYEFVAKAEAEE